MPALGLQDAEGLAGLLHARISSRSASGVLPSCASHEPPTTPIKAANGLSPAPTCSAG